MDELYQSVEKLPSSEAKNLLVNMMYRLKYIKDSKTSQVEMIEELYSYYNELLGLSPSQEYFEREYAAVHIVCGESPAGSLRVGLGRDNKVIGFPDIFAIGPLWKLDKVEGRQHRYEWLKDHLNIEMDFIVEEYEGRILKALEDIEIIPDTIPIVIWTGDNADEQTGIRYLLYLLKEKTNDIFLINTAAAHQEIFDTSEVQYFYSRTGQVVSEELNEIYRKKLSTPLPIKARKQFQNEWMALSETTEVLRVWQNNQIKSVNENYFDPLIINTAENLHADQEKKDFMKAVKLIGELLGNMESTVGDSFLEYRLRYLLYNGVFEIKGIPKGMRHYSVKLK